MSKGLPKRGLVALLVLLFLVVVTARAVLSLQKREAVLDLYPPGSTVYGYGVLVDDPVVEGGRSRILLSFHPLGGLFFSVTYPFALEFPARFGDRVWVKASIEPLNPCSARQNLRDLLVNKRIRGWGRGFRFAGDGELAPILVQLHRARVALYSKVSDIYGGQVGPLLAAMVMGMREHLPRDLRFSFRASGLAHLLAVSGFHVGVVALVVFLLLRSLLRLAVCLWPGLSISFWLLPSNLAGLLTILVVWLYAELTGGRASALRAALMLSLYILARIFSRDRPLLAAVASSFVLLLLFNPLFLFQPGFQLTYLAMLGILVILKGCSMLKGPLDAITAGMPRYLAGFVGGLLVWLAISLVLPIFLWPWVGIMFHRVSIVAPISNLVLTPLASALIAVGFLWLAVAPLLPTVMAKMLAKPVALLASLFLKGVLMLGKARLFPWVTIGTSLLLLSVVASISLAIILGRRWPVLPLLPLLAFAILNLFWFRVGGVVDLTRGAEPVRLCRRAAEGYLVLPTVSPRLVRACVLPGLMAKNVKRLEVVVTSSSKRAREAVGELCSYLDASMVVPMEFYLSARGEGRCRLRPLLRREGFGCFRIEPDGKGRIAVLSGEG